MTSNGGSFITNAKAYVMKNPPEGGLEIIDFESVIRLCL